MALVLGIDPDTRTTAWALVDFWKVLAVGVIRAKGDGEQSILRVTGVVLEGLLARKPEIVVIEGQKIYSGSKVAPNDILTLGQIGGGILGQVIAFSPTTKTCFPDPQAWKGQLPKPVEQARTFTHYGIAYGKGADYCWPSGCAVSAKIEGAAQLNKGDWKHVSDAIGLGLHGAKVLTGAR